MSEEIAKRLSTVEAGHQELRSDFKIMTERVVTLGAQVTKIGSGVEGIHDLLARRGDPLNFRTIVGTVLAIGAVLGMMGSFVWWFTASSPAITQLERRVTKIDDPDFGKLRRIEEAARRAGVLKGWEVVDGSK